MTAVHWLYNLTAWSAQAAILIGAGWAAAWIFRLRVPRVRLIYAQALLALCVLLPAVQPWHVPAHSQISITTHEARTLAPESDPGPAVPWRQALLIALAAGAAARTLWLAVGLARLRSLRRHAQPCGALPPAIDRLRLSIAPRTEFLQSAAISGPVTFGLRRPVIVVPPRFTELPPDLQEAIACHELLHVRRRDWIVNVLEEFVRAALWFHPGVWWLISQMQLAREQTVDGEVVEFTRNRAEYLNALLAMAGNRPAPDLAPATMFLRKRHLKNRVALLLKEVTMTKRTLRFFCATSGAVLVAAGWLALHSFPLQAAPAPQEANDPKLLHSVPPQYPAEARARHIEGAVVLEVNINAGGHVSDAHVLSGPEELRSAALEAVLQWHYSPEAMTLPATTQVTMRFTLSKDGSPVTDGQTAAPAIPAFTLRNVRIEGLTPASREVLQQRIAVRTGDTIDSNVLQSVMNTVRSFDDHLAVTTSPDDGTLRISLAQTPRIRVGGNVQQAKIRTKVQPVYPPEAKTQGIQGVVRMEATLDKSGNVANLRVLDGDPILAAAALDAVRQWQYQTTLLNGDPVEVVTQIDVNFTLSK